MASDRTADRLRFGAHIGHRLPSSFRSVNSDGLTSRTKKRNVLLHHWGANEELKVEGTGKLDLQLREHQWAYATNRS
eukprot:NODE_2671_length_561_cov_69.158203_g2293_i0.p1 GENE.NODE_2671_length_561_cov_69.158203_g2293_i0~~NODE_2671_length_561_cov_69.158203_g2293_i0.p1  ORF type:complete len:77 (+),score=1.57 NODE_2671_length_561_cov_69.158203_g2293_i0:167-397(+)